jgi:hypothetical protein
MRQVLRCRRHSRAVSRRMIYLVSAIPWCCW